MELKPVYPFEPVSISTPPAGDNWVAQIKWDGVRILLYYDGSTARLINRRMNERTLQYPELLDVNAFCKAQSVILDGEVIAFDQKKPSFYEVMKRDRLKLPMKIKQASVRAPITYMVFDVLFLNGEWVTEQTLAERQALLEDIMIPQPNIQIVQNYPDGTPLFEMMKQYRMEGVVYKDLGSTYPINGKDGRWRKQKVFHDLNAVVGGVTYRDKTVNALLLGIFTNNGDLIYIGHAGTGKLTRKDWSMLTEKAKDLQLDRIPFSNVPERSKDAVWVRPELTVKVEYLELTPGGTMRHPSIQGIVEIDKTECTVDQLSSL
ncbi:DNA ligase [Paenibacillus sp. N4]|uniref:ATP-dependent DNA ligase n=1 Tax=Paenibacillus vietnamensis TaxID=2590547 RepID=UPI001CD059A7|nr:DNA ligase [Paenibacillus vietnamensis]MCA0758518.1 DNA ligase [Paenibacillus vietnamensis]